MKKKSILLLGYIKVKQHVNLSNIELVNNYLRLYTRFFFFFIILLQRVHNYFEIFPALLAVVAEEKLKVSIGPLRGVCHNEP